MKGNRERINVAEAVRLMIKQIAVPLQILPGTEVLLRTRHAGAGSINFHRVGKTTKVHCKDIKTFSKDFKTVILMNIYQVTAVWVNTWPKLKIASVHHIKECQIGIKYLMVWNHFGIFLGNSGMRSRVTCDPECKTKTLQVEKFNGQRIPYLIWFVNHITMFFLKINDYMSSYLNLSTNWHQRSFYVPH